MAHAVLHLGGLWPGSVAVAVGRAGVANDFRKWFEELLREAT